MVFKKKLTHRWAFFYVITNFTIKNPKFIILKFNQNNSMSEEQKRILQQQLWNIANSLRGKMDADEFRDYILGFIFYKYLSERMHMYADEVLQEDGITYLEIDENSADGQEILEAVKVEAIAYLGYFLKPSELFEELAKRGNGNGTSKFILNDLAQILKHIEQSTMGTASEDDFD